MSSSATILLTADPDAAPTAAGSEAGGLRDGSDLFALGRRAAAARDLRLGARGSFVRNRQLLATGAWRGPRDASESYVETTDLAALGGFAAAAASGVGLLVGARDLGTFADANANADADADMDADPHAGLEAHRAARGHGARSLWRFSFRSGEPDARRDQRLSGLRALLREDIALWGVMPTPVGEPEGLDTLRLVATLRLQLPEVAHVVLDVAALGPRLAQMALGFGGDELWAPIVSERALRLGGNANNPAMTRKEAAVLIRGAGLTPCERTGPDTFAEETS